MLDLLSSTLLFNVPYADQAKGFYEIRRTAFDAELDYYLNGDGYNNLKDEIKLYEDEIKAANNKDLMDELLDNIDIFKKNMEKYKNINKNLSIVSVVMLITNTILRFFIYNPSSY